MLWDGNRQIQEYTDTHVFTTVYDQDSFEPVARIISDENELKVYHYHNDHLGTPNELTNDKGEVIWLADYEAWGNVSKICDDFHYKEQEISGIKVSSEDLQPIRFQGQFFDSETGLHYNRFRYYDSDLGMFISRDPIGLLGGNNVFQYAPNPVMWIDPFGLASCPNVKRGVKDRPETASITVTKKMIKKGGTGTNQSSRDYARGLGNSDDDAGHILAKALGGQGGKKNIFPQLPSINRGAYRTFEKDIKDEIMTNGSMKLKWKFTYKDKCSMRPTKITYQAYRNNKLVMKEDFDN